MLKYFCTLAVLRTCKEFSAYLCVDLPTVTCGKKYWAIAINWAAPHRHLAIVLNESFPTSHVWFLFTCTECVTHRTLKILPFGSRNEMLSSTKHNVLKKSPAHRYQSSVQNIQCSHFADEVRHLLCPESHLDSWRTKAS